MSRLPDAPFANRPELGVARLFVLAGALLCGRCVCGLDANGVGNSCEKTADCYTGLLCVHLDEDDLDTDTVCMPDVSFDRSACTDNDTCLHLGMPVEAFCTADECSCEDLLEADPPTCPYDHIFGRFACGCVKLDAKEVGADCEHPEQCASLICREGACANDCAEDNDCGGPNTSCESDGSCS